MTQKIHNIVFAFLILTFGLTFILLAFGNEKLGGIGIIVSLFLLLIEQGLMWEIERESRKKS